MQYIVDLAQTDWSSPAPGCRVKEVLHKGVLVRLVELARGYQEYGWCAKGHTGYVLSGQLALEFASGTVEAKTGDALLIPPGAGHKHRAHILGDVVRLILFESNEASAVATEADGQ